MNGSPDFWMPSSDGRTTWAVDVEVHSGMKRWADDSPIFVELCLILSFVAGSQRLRTVFGVDTDSDYHWVDRKMVPADKRERRECYLRAVVRYCRRHLDEIVAQEKFSHLLQIGDIELIANPNSGDTLQEIEYEIDQLLDLMPWVVSATSPGQRRIDLPSATVWAKHEPNLRRLRNSDERMAQIYQDVAEFYEAYQATRTANTDETSINDLAANVGRANTLGHHAVRALFLARQAARASTTHGRAAGTNSGWPTDRAIHLNSVTIENLRCFARVDVTLTPPEDTSKGQWLVLLGENGMGKTSMLRALALALLPEDTARNHVYELSGRAGLVRNTTGSQHAHGRAARIDVETGAGTTTVRIDPQRPREALSIAAPLSQRPLVLGYGCRRGSALGDIRRESNTDYLLGTATLFDEDARVIHADTWLRDIRDQNRDLFESVCHTLSSLLLGVERISVEPGGLTWAEGSTIGRVPLAGLSDGYLTTLGWLVDVLARWMDYARQRQIQPGPDFHKRMPCVVLIDEIDLHLHPRWQTEVIIKLRETFPMTTFVATTHNPLTLHGTQSGEVHVIRAGEDGSLEIVQKNLPLGIRTDELLTGEWFGLSSTLDADTQRLLQEHFALLQQGRPEGDPERVRLEEILRPRLGHFAATRANQLAQEIVAEQLDSVVQPVTDEDRARVRALYERRMRQAAQAAGQGQRGDEP